MITSLSLTKFTCNKSESMQPDHSHFPRQTREKTPKTISSSQAAINSHLEKSILNSFTRLCFVSFSNACKTHMSYFLAHYPSFKPKKNITSLTHSNSVTSLMLASRLHIQLLILNGKLNVQPFFILFFFQFFPQLTFVSLLESGVDKSSIKDKKGAQTTPSST